MKTLNDYLKLPYRLEIVPDTEEGGFTVYYPELQGCVTCGETMESAIKNAEDAKKEWISAALESGVSIPEPISTEDANVSQYSGQFKLRMPKTLHRKLAEDSKREGVSMNQYCVYLLARNDSRIANI